MAIASGTVLGRRYSKDGGIIVASHLEWDVVEAAMDGYRFEKT
jgi:hypothetical protein